MNSITKAHDRDVVTSIVTRTAERLGVEPMELEPLSTAIDPELVAAFATSPAVTDGSKLEFRYSGCNVRITDSGAVSVQRTVFPEEE